MPLTVMKVNVQRQVSFSREPLSTQLESIQGSGWVCDALQLAQSMIPFIEGSPTAALDVETIKQKLISLGIKASTRNQYPIIVTNAHVVDGMKSCCVHFEHDPTLHECTLLVVFPSRDLALILPPEQIIEDLVCGEISPIKLNSGQDIRVYGYPENGNGELSTTAGKLSRIIFEICSYSGLKFLQYESTATHNGGNSGGPVVIEESGQEKVVAIISQHATNASNQFHSIPIFHLIAAFQYYVAYGKDFGLLTLPLKVTAIIDPKRRAFYNFPPNSNLGVLITELNPRYEVPFLLKDILLSIDGYQINSEGKIELFERGKVPCESYLHFLPPYSMITCRVRRDNKTLMIKYSISASLHYQYRDYWERTTERPAFYRHGVIFMGNLDYDTVYREYQTSDGRNRMPLSLFRRLSKGWEKFKQNKEQGSVVFFPYINTMGTSVSSGPNVVTKIQVGEKTHWIRDIYHLFEILNSEVPEEKDPSQDIALYHGLKDDIATIVIKKLTPEEEKANQVQYLIDQRRFSPEQFRSKHLQPTKGWELLRSKYEERYFKPEKLRITGWYRDEVSVVEEVEEVDDEGLTGACGSRF